MPVARRAGSSKFKKNEAVHGFAPAGVKINLVRSEILVQGATWQKARTLIYVRIAAGVAN